MQTQVQTNVFFTSYNLALEGAMNLILVLFCSCCCTLFTYKIWTKSN